MELTNYLSDYFFSHRAHRFKVSFKKVDLDDKYEAKLYVNDELKAKFGPLKCENHQSKAQEFIGKFLDVQLD